MNRPALDAYFLNVASVVSTRSTCLRNQVGAVIVKDKRILSTGYNGAPSSLPHCEIVGCPRKDLPSGERPDLCRAVHAEENAIIQAALFGGGTAGATLYCTHQPCTLCAKMMINAKIVKVVFNYGYPDPKAIHFLNSAHIEIIGPVSLK